MIWNQIQELECYLKQWKELKKISDDIQNLINKFNEKNEEFQHDVEIILEQELAKYQELLKEQENETPNGNGLIYCPFCGENDYTEISSCERTSGRGDDKHTYTEYGGYCPICETFGPASQDPKKAALEWNKRAVLKLGKLERKKPFTREKRNG